MKTRWDECAEEDRTGAAINEEQMLDEAMRRRTSNLTFLVLDSLISDKICSVWEKNVKAGEVDACKKNRERFLQRVVFSFFIFNTLQMGNGRLSAYRAVSRSLLPPLDSYAWNYRQPVNLLYPSQSLSVSRLKPLII